MTTSVEGRKRAGMASPHCIGNGRPNAAKPSPALFGPSAVGITEGRIAEGRDEAGLAHLKGFLLSITSRGASSETPSGLSSSRRPSVIPADSPLFFTPSVASRLLSVAILRPSETVLTSSFKDRLRGIAALFTAGQGVTFDPAGWTASEAQPAAEAVAAFSRPAGSVPAVRAMTSSEQARADAIADAETLRMATPYPDPVAYAASGALWTATHDDPWSPSSSRDAGVWATVAARLAFRACPALREA